MSDPHPDFFDPPFDVDPEPDTFEPDPEDDVYDYLGAAEDPHLVPGTNIVAGTRHDPNL